MVAGRTSARSSPARTRATPGSAGQHVAHARQVGGVGDVDVGQLVVADGEGPAAERVERLAERARPDVQQAGLAQGAVGQHRPADLHVAVFAHHPDARPDGSRGVEQRGAGVVEFARPAAAMSQPAGPKRCGS